MTDTTPLPWIADPDGDLRNIVHERGKFCDVVMLGVKPGDAALIVTAVNAHDDLVKALEDFTNTYSEELQEHGYSLEEADEHDLIVRARSALAKAKGETK